MATCFPSMNQAERVFFFFFFFMLTDIDELALTGLCSLKQYVFWDVKRDPAWTQTFPFSHLRLKMELAPPLSWISMRVQRAVFR